MENLAIGMKSNLIKRSTNMTSPRESMYSPRNLLSPRNYNSPQKQEQLLKILKQQIQKNKRLLKNVQRNEEQFIGKMDLETLQYQILQQTPVSVHFLLQNITKLLDQNSKLQKKLKKIQTTKQVQKQIDEMIFENKKTKQRISQSTLDVTTCWSEIKGLWGGKINDSKKINKTSLNSNLSNRLQSMQQFLQDLNKKVVITKTKIQKLTKSQKTQQQTEDIQTKMLQRFKLSILDSKFIQEKQMKMKQKYEKQKAVYVNEINALKSILLEKNQEIVRLKEKVGELEIYVKQKIQIQKKNYQVLATPTMKSNLIQENYKLKSFQNKKELTLNMEIIESKSEIISKNKHLHQDQIQGEKTATINSINQVEQIKLSQDDPVFKIPCLSPKMLQMKCLEKMEIERRQKIRQMRKDVIGSKTMVNEVQNLAAGVNSPTVAQMLQNAQNPLKNKFIRKPMSPMYSVLYKSSKTQEQKNNTESQGQKGQNVNQQEKNQQIQTNVKQNQYKLQQESKPQPKLNLPYFISKKKKG